MKRQLDCFLIGHNAEDISSISYKFENIGRESPEFRDINLDFIQHNDKRYSASDAVNLLTCKSNGNSYKDEIVQLHSIFSNTIAYLGNFLNKHGFTFDFINSFNLENDYLAECLEEDEILSVAITTTYYTSPGPIIEMIKYIRDISHKINIIVGGPYIYSQYLTKPINEFNYLLEYINSDFYVVDSQGENALINLLDRIKNNKPVKGLNNVFYKVDSGYIKNEILRENNLLNDNTINWNLFSNRLSNYVNVRTAVSCPFKCAFCSFHILAGKYQNCKIKNIENELDTLKDNQKVNYINFIDDTFNIPKTRFKELLECLIEKNYNFKWICQFRCNYYDEEIVRLMKESGCVGVFLGIESGSDKILKNMNKSATTLQYLKGIELLKKYGILTFGSFIVGFPGETNRTFSETIDFLNQSGLDFYQSQIWFFTHHSPINKLKRDYNITGINYKWSHADMDFRRALDLQEEMVFKVQSVYRVPKFDFEFDGIVYMLQKLNANKIKTFLSIFNQAIQRKLISNESSNIDAGILQQFQKLEFTKQRENENFADKYNAQLDF